MRYLICNITELNLKKWSFICPSGSIDRNLPRFETYISLFCGAGMGMRRLGQKSGVKKFQLHVGHGYTLNSTWKDLHTGKVTYRHKVLEYVSTTTSNFSWLQNFSAFLYHMTTWRASKQSILSYRLRQAKVYLMVSNSLTLESWKVRSLRLELESLTNLSLFKARIG